MRTRITDKNVANFPVTAYKLIFENSLNEQYIKGDRGFAIVRTDANIILKTVKTDYILVRHQEVFNCIETALIDTPCELYDILFWGVEGSSISIRYNLLILEGIWNVILEVTSSYDENVPSSVSLGIRHPEHDCEFFGIKTIEIKPTYLSDGTVNNGIIKAVKTMLSAMPDTVKAMEELFRHWLAVSCEPTSVTMKIFSSGREAGRFINSGLFDKIAKKFGNNSAWALAISLAIFAIHYQTNGDKIIELQKKIIPKLKQLYPIKGEK